MDCRVTSYHSCFHTFHLVVKVEHLHQYGSRIRAPDRRDNVGFNEASGVNPLSGYREWHFYFDHLQTFCALLKSKVTGVVDERYHKSTV